jgi:hypothetical protein
MNGFEYILEKQISWADRNKIKLVGSEKERGRPAYTEKLKQNLFQSLSTETKKDFEKGDGNELYGDKTHSAKMNAVHSSSALCVNVFHYWIDKNIPDLAYALGLCEKSNKSAKEIPFEQKFPISDHFQIAPNIDAVILNEESSKIKAFGIECKFSEAYSSYKHSGISEEYLKENVLNEKEISDLWKGIPNIKNLAVKISPEDNIFKYLHPAQLIKHILGLKRKYGKSGFRLLYLWYDVPGYEGCEHRKEIEEFTKIVKQDHINFHSISYQELIIKLKKDFYKGNEEYIDYLTDRYL